MMPPIAVWLLRAASPAGDLPYVLAELEMEYESRILPQRGLQAARRWFWSQALRSLGSLAMIGLRRGDWEYSLLAVLLASAGSALLMQSWWSYILCQVPLKAGEIRGGDFILLSVAVTAALGLFAGMLCSTRGLLLAIPAAWTFSLLGQAAVRNVAPVWFSGATLLALTAALVAGAWLRKVVDRPNGGRFA
jgi:hypothetical protein